MGHLREVDKPLSKMRRGWQGISVVVILGLAALIVSVIAYVAVQRGPIHALDCVITDDFYVEVEEPPIALSALAESVKQDTRNCVSVRVISGPTDDDAIVTSTETKWMLYRGDYNIEVSTAPAE